MSDDQTTDDATATGDAADTKPPADLGDAGKKALEAERAARKDAERKLKELEDRDKTEQQRLQDQLAERDAQLADLPKQARTQAIRFASQATAAGFLDPEDALLNLADVDLVDLDAVKAALEALAERKPHLVRQDRKKPPTRPKPKTGDATDDATGGLSGKERAAAALRQMRN
jgi:hypothetical protein